MLVQLLSHSVSGRRVYMSEVPLPSHTSSHTHTTLSLRRGFDGLKFFIQSRAEKKNARRMHCTHDRKPSPRRRRRPAQLHQPLNHQPALLRHRQLEFIKTKTTTTVALR